MKKFNWIDVTPGKTGFRVYRNEDGSLAFLYFYKHEGRWHYGKKSFWLPKHIGQKIKLEED